MMKFQKAYLALAIIVTLYVIGAYWFFNWVIDDLYIYFRYARNFSGGDGIAFNPGEHVEGFSSFTWFLILSFYNVIGLPLESASKISGIIISIINLFLIFTICKTNDADNTGLLACFLSAMNLPFILWSVSGFEIPFYIFLLLFCFYRISLLDSTSRNFILLSISIFLIAITRPEGILFSLTYLFFIYRFTASKSFTFKTVALFIVLVVSFLLFRLFYFGDVLQNTYYAKIGHGIIGYYELRSYKNGFFYIADFFAHNPQFLILFLMFILMRKSFFTDVKVKFASMIILIQFVFVIFSGGDWMVQYRFLVPAIPFISICSMFALKKYADTSGLKRSIKYSGVIAIILIAAIAFSISDFATVRKETVLWNNVKAASLEMKKLIPPGELAAIGSCGIIPYNLSDVRFLDMVGLTNKYIARNGLRHGTWFERSLPDYVYSQHPKWLVMWKRKNASGVYTFSKASPCYLDMALNENFNKYLLQTYYDVYDGDRIELYKLREN